MLEYANTSKFIKQVIHPFVNNLKLLIKDNTNLIFSTKNEILDTIKKLSNRHDKDISDLHDRCSDIDRGYKDADAGISQSVDDLDRKIDNIKSEVSTLISNSGTCIYTTNGIYTATRTGPHFVVQVGGGGGSFGVDVRFSASYVFSRHLWLRAIGNDSLITCRVLNLVKGTTYNVSIGGAGIGRSVGEVQSAFGDVRFSAGHDYRDPYVKLRSIIDTYYSSATGGSTVFGSSVAYGGASGIGVVLNTIDSYITNTDKLPRYEYVQTYDKYPTIRYGTTGYTRHPAQGRVLLDAFGVGGWINANDDTNNRLHMKANGTPGVCVIF